MISIIHVNNTRSRVFGWVQDSSNFRSLCDVVAIFDNHSTKHRNLVNSILPRLVLESDGRDDLIMVMNSTPLKIKYIHLTGTSFTPRSTSRCNGIVQAVVKGQGREFIGDWPADNFVRWAHCLGFIKYDYTDDTFSITKTGLGLTGAYAGNGELSEREREIITDAMLTYPPAIRVLSLLSEDNAHLTKFEIGQQLGFIGENGFGSMSQNVLIRSLTYITDVAERNKIRNNWEGSSDKYARMIAAWLAKLGLVKKISKPVTINVSGSTYTETIGQSYMITACGITALNRSYGKSRHQPIPKNISYEMLATKVSDRDYLRTRRALTIKLLSEHANTMTLDDIVTYLEAQNVKATKKAVLDDIQGLRNIGLDITVEGDNVTWCDIINDFVIPIRSEITSSTVEQTKDNLREIISHISHDYLSLLELAYDNKQNRLFEIKTLQLLTEECGYEGLHLGGSRKPDGIIYSSNLTDNYGLE